MIYIFDIDGTLADTSCLQQYIKDKDWDAFYTHLYIASPIPPACELARTLEEEHTVMFLTARAAKSRKMTQEWLINNACLGDVLLMRPDNDFRPSPVVKLDLLDKWFGGRNEALKQVTIIFEDQIDNVRAFRAAGFTCYQVTSHS